MDNEIKINDDSADYVRLFGRIILITGIALLTFAQLMEISVNEYDEIDVKTLIELPKKIADKTNFTLLGGLLIIIGLQLSLVSNQVIIQIKEQLKKTSSTVIVKEDLEDK